MTGRPRWGTLLGLAGLALILFFGTFAVPEGNFWVKISVTATVLASLSLLLRRSIVAELRLNLATVALGVGSAAALYVIFVAGRFVSLHLFSFAGNQIGGIYDRGTHTPLWAVALLLLFVTGPGEEIFWRGFLQRGLQERLGAWPGYLLATALYAGVHLCSMNVILIGAAAVAGLFWGAFYWKTRNLTAAIISHSVWSAVIFAVLPLH